MNIYRTLLWWLALALLGALAWEWLATDPGELVLRLRGQTITTTVAFGLVAWGLLWFLLWALWWLLRLPLRAWRRHARRQARMRLISGLAALHQGRWQRAEGLLLKAAEDTEVRSAALLAARQAADARGDREAAALHQSLLLAHDAAAAALEQAERLLAQGRGEETLAALRTITEPLPPRGQRLRAEALCQLGRAQEACGLLNGLRHDQALSAEGLAGLELRLTAAALVETTSAEQLQQRWQALPARLQEEASVAAAFARRAAVLGLEDAAANALAQALRARWNEDLVGLYGRLPAGQHGSRLAEAEAWLGSHGASPGLLVALGRLCLAQQLSGQAEQYLHRGIAQGGGGEAWEVLGQALAAQNDAERAQIAFANALRVARGEAALSLGGRSLREQIAAEAVAEQRNEHGLPLLPR